MLFGFISPNVSDNSVYMVQCTNTTVVSTMCNELDYLVVLEYCGVIKFKFAYCVFIIFLGTAFLVKK